jgi:acetyl esterase/lipase
VTKYRTTRISPPVMLWMPTWLRRTLLGLLAVALGIAVALSVYALSVEPGAAIVKAAFERGAEVAPPTDFDAIAAEVKEDAGVALNAKGAPLAHLDIYSPRAKTTAARSVILWIHGGGFISSSANTVRDYAILLAHRGYVVGNLDYSLAPGAHYPVPVEQANAALAYLTRAAPQFGGDPTRMFIGGDSAGAQIASEVGSVETNPQLASALDLTPGARSTSVRGVILFCGLYDMRTVGATDFPALRTYLWAYTGQRDWTEFPNIDQLSTTTTATAKYPPTFLTVGDVDPFRTQTQELAGSLRDKGVRVTTLLWNGTHPGLSHEYQFDFTLPQAQVAFIDTLRFLHESKGDK